METIQWIWNVLKFNNFQCYSWFSEFFLKLVISVLERSVSYSSTLSLCTWVVLLTSKVYLHKCVISELGVKDLAVKCFRCIWLGFLGWIRARSFAQMLWLDWRCKNCSQLTALLPLRAADQGHHWECLIGSVYKIESLIQHFHFANKGDILCLLRPVKPIMNMWCISQLNDICVWLQCWSLAVRLCVRSEFGAWLCLGSSYNLEWVRQLLRALGLLLAEWG